MFELCLALAIEHPDLLGARLTDQQLSDWATFFNLRPFGWDVLHQLLAQVAATIAAAHGGSRTIDDFMVKSGSATEFDPEKADLFVTALPGGAAFLESLRNGTNQKP